MISNVIINSVPCLVEPPMATDRQMTRTAMKWKWFMFSEALVVHQVDPTLLSCHSSREKLAPLPSFRHHRMNIAPLLVVASNEGSYIKLKVKDAPGICCV